MKVRRAIVGIISATMIVAALVLWFFGGTGELPLVVGMMARVGFVLLAIFVAWPTLERYVHHLPAFVTATIALGALLLAIRPKLVPLVIGMVLLVSAVHFGMRYLSKQIK